ncbi:NADH-quinone oxidoreductase subunit M [Rhodococcus sp. BP22]|uniref:NADH-quinone oxidoreductase subunit M n=1 Tax=Rhodococcus sp. BP22 TaxID=2758566 RepID=UPI0016494AE4|nr:NADH-quinone oxidoreductase subunit M [Rhodococcus sp. BP22]
MVNSFPWLTTLWVLPIIGAAVALAMPKARAAWAKVVALVASLLTLVVAVVVAVRFEPGGARYQFVESHSWIEAFGARYDLGVDGIAVVLILLTAVLLPLLLVAGWNDPRIGRSAHLYVALILAVESMVLMSFSALDILLFYVFFEAMLIPMYFLIGGFGGTHRASAAVKFLLYNLLGGLVMLAAVVGLYVVTGTFGFREIAASAAAGDLGISPGLLNALFLGFMFAFAVKAPLWPFHSWLPGAAVESTPATAVLMMAVVDKVGTFGMLRYCLQLFPDASKYFAPLVVTLAVIGIVYGAILAIASTDVMRLIAYTSISHFGFIILGIFAMTSQGQTGSTLYMVNHGISTAALFLVAGFLVSRRGTRAIDSYGGIQKVAPVLAGTFLIAGLATLSLPGLAPFVSEFLVLIGTFTRYQVAAVVATSALVLSAVYILWLYQRVMTGPLEKKNADVHDLVPRELAVMVPLITLLIVLGLYPKPILDIISPAVATTVISVDSDDLTADGQAGIR